MVAVRDSVSHLFSLGRYEDVRVHASTLPNGVALVFELLPLHPVTRITFSGTGDLPGIDEGRLRQLIAERFGTSPRAGRAADIGQLIEGDLRQLGYLRARATPATDVEHISERADAAVRRRRRPARTDRHGQGRRRRRRCRSRSSSAA